MHHRVVFTHFVTDFLVFYHGYSSKLMCGRLKYEQDLVVNLEYERGKMTALCDQESQQINRLKEVLEIVKQYVLNVYVFLAAFVTIK